MDATFNPRAIPFAVLAVLFGTLTFLYRKQLETFLGNRLRRKTPKLISRIWTPYTMLFAIWCYALAALALFSKFD